MSDRNIGALWVKQSQKGTEFMSGNIEVGDEIIKLVVFKNNYKKTDKHPDYLIYESKPLEQQNSDDEPF